MSNFYTNVFQRGNYLYVRGVENGQSFSDRVEYYPTIWINGKLGAGEEWKTLSGESVYSFQPGTIRDTKQWVESNKDIGGRNVYTAPANHYQYIAENYKGNIVWDKKHIKVAIIDIETEAENGFANPKFASEELLLITVHDLTNDKTITFGRGPYNPEGEGVGVKYVQCDTEQSLIRSFLSWWTSNYPDVLTGWNSGFFDLTYLFNRIVNTLGEDMAKKLSPWGFVYQKEVVNGGRTDLKTSYQGIACLDYLDLYKKFGTYSAKESYKLDNIAFEELGERKLENPEPVFRDFYSKRWNTFITYNIVDVLLIKRLDSKLKLIDLALTLAYEAKINYEDVFSPVKMWDVIIYNYLNDQKVVIPPIKNNHKLPYEGGYVKDPLIGKHKWAVSLDLNSLYPHLIMQYNLSPETISGLMLDVTTDGLLEKQYNFEQVYKNNLTIAGNGWCFHRDKRGLLPTLMELFYNKRVTYKKEMIRQKQLYEESPSPEIKDQIARLNSLQLAIKIAINAAYGACGNNYFRHFDLRIARAITLSGQLSIRWIANKMNEFMNQTMKTSGVDYIILIDTDSIVLSLEDLVEKVCPNKTTEQKIAYMDKVADQVIQPFIDKSYQELADYMNAYEQKMVMKRENLVDVMLSIAKKHYVMSVHNSEGVQYHEPKLKIMGLEMIKASTPSVVRKKLKESLKTILYNTEKDVQLFIEQYKTEFNTLSAEDIAFPRSVSDVSKYYSKSDIYCKGTPIHVRGALLYNYYIKQHNLTHKYPLIQDGDKIRFIYLRTPNPIQENVIAFIDKLPEEFGLSAYVNYTIMFEKVFRNNVQNVIEPLGWNAELISTLEDWFE